MLCLLLEVLARELVGQMLEEAETVLAVNQLIKLILNVKTYLLILIATLLPATNNPHLKVWPKGPVESLVLLNIVRRLSHRLQNGGHRLDQQCSDVLGRDLLHARDS